MGQLGAPLSNLITKTFVHALNRKDTAKKIDLACKMEARTKSKKIHISKHVLKKNCPILHLTLKRWRLTWLLTWGSCSVMADSLQIHGLYSLPGSSVHGILQKRILEWVANPFSRGSSWLRDQTQVFHIAGRFFTNWATRETSNTKVS